MKLTDMPRDSGSKFSSRSNAETDLATMISRKPSAAANRWAMNSRDHCAIVRRIVKKGTRTAEKQTAKNVETD